ncbi:MAG TPA: cytochrome c [Clostridia bacterium]|nr:cytochrome c [Clostridia bacterium]
MNKFAMKAAGCLTATILMSAMTMASAGEDIYKAKCAACHGADGAGAMAKKMGGRDLNSPEVQKASDKELSALIETGKGKMPAYKGKLTDAQVSDLVKHIRTLKK